MAFVELSSQRATCTASGSNAGKTLAFPGNVTAGSLLVVGGSVENGTRRALVSASGAGAPGAGAWLTINAIPLANGISTTWISTAIAPASGACTVAVTWLNTDGVTGNAYGTWAITEFTGTGGAVMGRSAIATSSSPSPGSVDVLTGDLILGVINWVSSATPTVPSSWTQIGTQNSNAADATFNFAYRIRASAATETPTWALSGSAAWVSQVMVVRPSGGSSGGGVGTLAGPRVIGGSGLSVF